MPKPVLTLLMATHNGAETLSAVLGAYCKLHPPDGGWDLIIVDNGSTDGTKEIIASFRSRLPLTCISEPILGKSVALNTGLRYATGDLVLLTDDDVLPRPDWLAQMRLAANSQPSFSIFGGAIVPHWEIPPEDWILTWCPRLGITDPALEEGPIAAARIHGANMAVRAEAFKAGYRFDTALGPGGQRYQMGEDTEFAQRLAKAGFKAWHCKRAVVAHLILKDQMNKEWVLRRAIPSGRAEYRREFTSSPASPKLLLGIPRYMIREILTQAIRFERAKFSQDADTVFRERWQLHFLAGRAIEGRMIHKRVKSPPERHLGTVRF